MQGLLFDIPYDLFFDSFVVDFFDGMLHMYALNNLWLLCY